MMNCTKNMIRVGPGIVTVLLAAYMIFPEFRTAIIGLAPFALAMTCPISMLLMLKMMSSQKPQHQEQKATVPVENNPAKPQESAS